MKDSFGKLLRVVAIIFMGITGAMNLLGGIGTVCAAFLTEQYPSMAAILDYQWLYQGLMIATVLIGLGGIWGTIRLVKGGENTYRNVLLLLVLGTVVGALHYFASMTLRGSAAPANMKLYINIFTLILFLMLKLPGISQRVDFDRPTDTVVGQTAAGLTTIIVGVVVISTSLWVGSSHVFDGANWTDVLKGFLTSSGLASIGMGMLMLLASVFKHTLGRTTVQTR